MPTTARPSLAALGVGCVTCHAPAGLADDAVLAVPGDSHAAPHAVVASAGFAGASACAGCHEFTFPGRAEAMQLTLREHAASRFAATACADCHMPAVADERARGVLAGAGGDGFLDQLADALEHLAGGVHDVHLRRRLRLRRHRTSSSTGGTTAPPTM